MSKNRILVCRLQLQTSETFRAWLAGLIDGEGNFNIHLKPKKGKNPRVRIVLEEHDRFVLEYIKNTIGGFIVYRSPQKSWKSNCQPQYEWKISSYVDCIEFTKWILPFLVLKKEKASSFLEAIQ